MKRAARCTFAAPLSNGTRVSVLAAAACSRDRPNPTSVSIDTEVKSVRAPCRPRASSSRAIADAVGVAQQSVAERIADFTKNGKFSDSGIFGDFERDGSSRQIDANTRPETKRMAVTQ